MILDESRSAQPISALGGGGWGKAEALAHFGAISLVMPLNAFLRGGGWVWAGRFKVQYHLSFRLEEQVLAWLEVNRTWPCLPRIGHGQVKRP